MSVSNTTDIKTKIQAGKQSNVPLSSIASGSLSGAAAASGSISGGLHWNTIGTTLHSTLVGFIEPPGASSERMVGINVLSNRAAGFHVVNLYQVGTLDLTTSSSEFTHDAATFPILRTKMGQASQALNLVPYIYITTATTTTAAQLTINYKNQAGASITGTVNFTLPSATTAAGSLYRLPLEFGDSGVQDITDIVITTTASAGAATIYLAEIIDTTGTPNANQAGFRNNVTRSPTIPYVTPGAATSGTAVVKSTVRFFGTAATTTSNIRLQTFMDI